MTKKPSKIMYLGNQTPLSDINILASSINAPIDNFELEKDYAFANSLSKRPNSESLQKMSKNIEIMTHLSDHNIIYLKNGSSYTIKVEISSFQILDD